MNEDVIASAAQELKLAEVLIITAGAGMGVDSGLPDFRGDTGFWRAYPMYQRLGLSFVDAANPAHFERDPAFGWGFYGHRTNLYRDTVPHAGFHLLLEWMKRFRLDCFVVTSNVDGQFQKAGFPDTGVLEVHGSIHHLQCTSPCSRRIWENRESITIDTGTMRSETVPLCPHCGAVARPNILMFGDYGWVEDRTAMQERRFQGVLSSRRGKRTLVIEIGAGCAIPTIRAMSERLGSRPNSRLLRINPREYQVPRSHLSLCSGALEGLGAIDDALHS